MSRRTCPILVCDGSDRGAALASALGESDRTVTRVSAPDAATSAIESGVGCILCGAGDDGDALAQIDALRAEAPTVPLVALLSADDASPAAALEAGATDVVQARGELEAWLPLLERRLDRLRDERVDPGAAVYRDVIDRLGDDRDGLACLFDETGRHHLAVGEVDAPFDLEADRFRKTAIDDVGLDPAARTQLRANYRAACAGETRSRTMPIDGHLYRVETEPIPAADGRFGLAIYAPAATPAAFGADDETTTGKVKRLHEIVRGLDDTDGESAICDFVVERAAELVDFDACGIAEQRGGDLVELSATAERPYQFDTRLGADEGVAGRTIEGGETIVVDELDGTNEDFRSVVSIPMGPDGVFQLLSTEPAAFSPVDRLLTELLVAFASNAVARVRFEGALTRERDRFAALFQNIPDAAIQYEVVDGEPVIESVNSAFVRLFGFEPDEAVGSPVIEVLVPEDERDDASALYDAVLEGDRVDAEVERLTDDGVAPFLLRSVPIPTDGDDQHGYFIYTDISTLVQRERELERQNERLDAFASIVSHDLRNPLSIAEGYLQTAIDSGDIDHLAVVDEELDRMRRMIEDLLTLAREGDTIGEPEPVELTVIVESAWAGVDTADGTVSIGDLPTVDGDPDRLRQLFENLFRNAVLHGGDDVAVEVDTFDGGIYVADDGPGVPDDLKEEIIDAGVSTAKGDGGTGFGLAIVDQVASAHGWSITVTDSASGGARFELRLDPDEDDPADASG